jgi:ribose transport system permease protein
MAGRLAQLRAIDPSRYIVYVGFVLILVGFSIVLRDDGFLTTRNLLNIVQQTTPITIMAVGMVFVLTAGEIDLSIGPIVAVSALLTSLVLRENFWFLGAATGLLAGAAIGAMNGLLVAYMRLPSFLVTLATMGFLAGLARWITDLQSVPIANETFNGIFGAGALFGIPSLVIWTLGIVFLGHFFYRETRYGAHVHAIGDSAQSARAVGIKVDRVRFSVMMLSGLAAGLAGLLYAGRLHGARYTLGETDLLTVIAAVIVGGTRLNGGVGTIFGALIGSLLMGLLNNGLILMGLSVAEQLMVRGLILLVAIALTLREVRR